MPSAWNFALAFFMHNAIFFASSPASELQACSALSLGSDSLKLNMKVTSGAVMMSLAVRFTPGPLESSVGLSSDFGAAFGSSFGVSSAFASLFAGAGSSGGGCEPPQATRPDADASSNETTSEGRRMIEFSS
jgi:hypothetical protein